MAYQSEKTMILSPLSSWYRMRNSQALILCGFITHKSIFLASLSDWRKIEILKEKSVQKEISSKYIRLFFEKNNLLKFLKIFRSHGTPHLCALNAGKMSAFLQIQPIRFVQFRPQKVVQILNFIVLSDECGSQAELTMRTCDSEHLL